MCFIKKVSSYLVFDEDISIVDDAFTSYINKDNKNLTLFVSELPKIKEDLKKDLDFFMISDPAINSIDEVKYAYPGFKAIVIYRIAHLLFQIGLKLEARLVSEVAHSMTAIDIHPGAKIDSPFFIDHGTGIVIGETAIIGSYVKIYQGVTLGALSLENATKLKNVKRHPTISSHVTLYSCASILGDVTIGENTTIGANVFLTEDVEENVVVRIGKPSLVYRSKN